MTKEQLIALGLDEATAQKVAAASSEEFKGYVTKERFNEVNEAKKDLEGQVVERDKQLDLLKKSTGDVEGLKKQIGDLQTANKTSTAEYETKLKDLQFTNAIKLAIADKAQDVDLVVGLFDKSKLILSEDGKITGLDEQVKTLQESKAFLFRPAAGKANYVPNGGADGSASKNPFAKDSFNLTEQGKILTEDPAQAKALAAEAGVTI